MKKFLFHLKNHFVPHRGNDHKPHFLRHESMYMLFLFVFVIETVFLVQTFIVFNKTNLLATVLPGVLTTLTNEDRTTNGVSMLVESKLLNKAAEMKAKDMALRGYFAHNAPDGKTPWYWLEQVGYKYSYAGENLAVNFFESKDVAQAWMNSPTHRANMVKKEFKEIGIGVAGGIYEGKDTIFVVQFFGTPAYASVTKAPIVKKNLVKISEVKVNTPAEMKVLGEETSVAISGDNVASISSFKMFINKVLTSPREYSMYIFLAIILLILIALLLVLFIKTEIKHPAIILRGFGMITIIVFLTYLNLYTFNTNTEVPASGIGANVISAFQ